MDGKTLRDAIISGANLIFNHRETVDELNVFPVPDGDTGANMSATMKSTLIELNQLGNDVDINVTAEKAASAMLRGARGNSGVILSLLFRGLSKGLAGKATATTEEFWNALELGVKAAYKSVMKPTEGTILTVAREATAAALIVAGTTPDFSRVFSAFVNEAEMSLARTPELLPVLKKAGVVDSGGMGYLHIIKGMQSVIDGHGIVTAVDKDKAAATVTVTNAAGLAEFDEETTFAYCTEFLVRKAPNAADISALRAYLESLGDSVVVVDDDEIIKVHVHTDNPGKALEEGLLFGSLDNVKIENMRLQHDAEIVKAQQQMKNKLPPKAPEDKFGFVAVVSGAGLETLFSDLGANSIVRGGQTFNPSTEDIVEAVLATPAHTVFVLPNNKNIILAAEQARKFVNDRTVIVLQTRTIPQGVSAMLSFDPDLSEQDNAVAMTQAIDNVSTGLVTFAVRDSDFEEKKISKGDILAMENGKLTYVEKDITRALIRITKRMVKGDSQFVTVMYGADVSVSDAESAFRQLKAKICKSYGDVEVVLINGGQPVYYYIVSVE